jgi:RecB family exonuclease
VEQATLDLSAPPPALPAVEVEERPIRLSYSSMSAYELCPLQYRFKYVDGEPVERRPALSFGESLHEALRLFHHQPVPVAPSLGRLLGYLEQVWDPAGYPDPREERAYFDHARQVLAAYHRANAKRFNLPVALEQRFELAVGDVTVTGVIDRMDRHPDGSYEIIDYKTNRRLPPRRIVEQDLQLSIYYLAAQEVWGITPAFLTMYYLLPGQRVTTTRKPADAVATRERISEVGARIASGAFEARENRLCDWCDFRARCPLFAHAFRRTERPDPPDVAAIVDEWIAVERRRRADTARLETLSARVNAILDTEGLERIIGADGAITRRVRPETGARVLALGDDRRG